jgi:hypothetical protein
VADLVLAWSAPVAASTVASVTSVARSAPSQRFSEALGLGQDGEANGQRVGSIGKQVGSISRARSIRPSVGLRRDRQSPFRLPPGQMDEGWADLGSAGKPQFLAS